MTYFEVGFKLKHDCPFNRISSRYPEVVLSWWTNFDQDVLEAAGWDQKDAGDYRRALKKSIREMGGHVSRSETTGSECHLVVSWDGTKWKNSASRTFVKNNCLVLQPTVHTDGWEWYRVIAFSEEDMRAMFREMDRSGEVEVISKRTVNEGTVRDTLKITTSDLLGGLTGNQADALGLALDSGYYSVPKRATTEDVAARVGLPRTTFEERLRKAESKVLESVAPYVRFSAKGKERHPVVEWEDNRESGDGAF
jgi:predicted DNA binding protein